MRPTESHTDLHWRRAWGAYLRGFRWSHAVHLTSRFATTVSTLQGEFHRFHRIVARKAQRRTPYFYAIEEGIPGHGHIHGLLSGTDSLSVEQLASCWRLGFTAISIYDPALTGTYYCTKDLSAIHDEYDFDFRGLERLSRPRAA